MPAKGHVARAKTRTRDASRSLKVAIIEDDEAVREMFANLISRSPGMKCIGRFSSCEAALEAFGKEVPHVLLMDIGLPGMSGIEGTRQIKERYPFVDILILTVYDDDEKIFQSICAGASGYILKNSDPSLLIGAIHEIQTGAPMSASIARRVLDIVRQNAPAAFPDIHLTPRELDILHSLVEGLSYKRIGEKHFISPLTVHTHIKRIYEKLRVHSKSEAVSKVLKRRLFSGS